MIQGADSPGADRAAVDARIWELFGATRAVMFTDLGGFCGFAANFGIIHFLQTIRESERLLVPIIEGHDGTVLKFEADSMLIVFRQGEAALRAALAMQLGDQPLQPQPGR